MSNGELLKAMATLKAVRVMKQDMLVDAERLVDIVLDLEKPGYRSTHVLANVLKTLIKFEKERTEVSR